MRLTAAVALCCVSFSFQIASAQTFREAPARPITAHAQAAPAKAADTAEQHAARAMDAAKYNRGALAAFLREMPKGGDLHNHITGAAYAESYIQFAAQDGLCVDQKMKLSRPPCKEGQAEAKSALKNPALYAQMINAWSMRGFVPGAETAHDHFFDTFPKFGEASHAHLGDLLAEVSRRAADQNIAYLELMTTPDNAESIGFASKFQWDGNFSAMRKKMLDGGMQELVERSRKNLDEWDAQKNSDLHCKASNPAQISPACHVAIRHLYTVLRAFTPEQVFAQLLIGFELAKQEPRVVGINMVQPEDWYVPMHDYSLHMKMVSYLHEVYPTVHISLHAGELAPGLVPPDGLRFHVREAVEVGNAERIGHGVDVMYEDNPQQLLSEMARRNTMVEICLTSNDVILGVTGKQHPLHAYLKAGVPVALATDDEGVSRSDLTMEYLKAVEEQGLDYPTLKSMARTSIEHSFVAGQSLWADSHRFTPVRECASDRPSERLMSATCQKFLGSSEKARLEWTVEKQFAEFESKQ